MVVLRVLEGSHQVATNTDRCARRRNVTLLFDIKNQLLK